MKYKERYPELVAYLMKICDGHLASFESLAECLNTYFATLFNLEGLNEAAAIALANPSLAAPPRVLLVFSLFLRELGALSAEAKYEAPQLLTLIVRLFRNTLSHVPPQVLSSNPSLSTGSALLILEECLVYPKGSLSSVKQVGYLENLLAGSLGYCEPISMLDMLRLAYLYAQETKYLVTLEVVSTSFTAPLKQWFILPTTRIFLVNFNEDPRGVPKWGAVQVRFPAEFSHIIAPVEFLVFCEVALTSKELTLAENTFGPLHYHPRIGWEWLPGGEAKDDSPGAAKMTEAATHGSTRSSRRTASRLSFVTLNRDSVESTGYTALAWLHHNMSYVEADLASLVRGFALCLAELPLTLIHGVESKHFHPDMVLLAESIGIPLPKVNGSIIRLRSLIDIITQRASLGFLAIEDSPLPNPIESGDLTKAVQHLVTELANKKALQALLRLAAVANPRNLRQLVERLSNDRIIEHRNVDGHISSTLDYRVESANLILLRELVNVDFYKIVSDEALTDSEIAAWIMIALFLRAHANSHELTIKIFPSLRLTPRLVSALVAAVGNNPYLLKLDTEGHASLSALQHALTPMMARNRLLRAIDHKLKRFEDYWRVAAQSWLIQCCTLSYLSRSGSQAEFKREIATLGILGLNTVLELLRDKNTPKLLNKYLRDESQFFYLGLTSTDQNVFLVQIRLHFISKAYFPFSKLIVGRYKPSLEHDSACQNLLTTLNQDMKIKELVFSDFELPSDESEEMEAALCWLNGLLAQAVKESWTISISIPALEEAMGPSTRGLRALYGMLNNLINSHQLRRLETADLVPLKKLVGAIHADAHSESSIATPIVTIGALATVPDDKTYPLLRDGGLRLQRQQQQQIQQQRHVKQQHHELSITEDLYFSGAVITYSDIDSKLGDICRDLAVQEGLVLDESAATLRLEGASLLQNLFHTWIHAYPLSFTKHTIGAITKEAALMLLRHQKLFCSGLNPEHLPMGFYTQYSRAGLLVLCYSIGKAYVKKPTPLSTIINFSRTESRASWTGDFRQLDMDYYLSHPEATLDERAWRLMSLFAELQPVVNSSKAFAALCHHNPAYASLFEIHQEIIKAHWLLFWQVWTCFGESGLEAFVQASRNNFLSSLRISSAELVEFLMSASGSGSAGSDRESLLSWYSSLDFLAGNKAFVRALGRLYASYPHEGVLLFLSLLQTIEQRLGRDFLQAFYESVLQVNEESAESFDIFLTPTTVQALEKMIEKLSPADKAGDRHLWLSLLKKQMQSMDMSSVAFHRLWNGFSYFQEMLHAMDIVLEPTTFDYLLSEFEPVNICVYLERLLDCLTVLPTVAEKYSLLAQLPSLDMSNSGVPFALKHEGIKYVAHSLVLHDFAHTGSGYTFPLSDLYSDRIKSSEHKATLVERMLASHKGFNELDAKNLCHQIMSFEAAGSVEDLLLWVLHFTQTTDEARASIDQLTTLTSATLSLLSKHIHQAIYTHKISYNSLDVAAIVAFTQKNPSYFSSEMLRLNSSLLLFEVISYLDQHGEGREKLLFSLLSRALTTSFSYPEGMEWSRFCNENAIRLSALYALDHPYAQDSMPEKLSQAYLNSVPGLSQLIKQLLALDVAASRRSGVLFDKVLSEHFISITMGFGIYKYSFSMLASEAELVMARYRKGVIDQLTSLGLVFKSVTSGHYRLIKKADIPNLASFGEKAAILQVWMLQHLALPVGVDGHALLMPLLSWMKALQMSDTYLDEFASLLDLLSQTKEAHYWNAAFLNSLLETLQPDNTTASFPLSILKSLLEEASMAARPIEEVHSVLDKDLRKALHSIVNKPLLDHAEKKALTRLCVREQQWGGTLNLSLQLMDSFEAHKDSKKVHHQILETLLACENIIQLKSRFDLIEWLMHADRFPSAVCKEAAQASLVLWIKALKIEQVQLWLKELKGIEKVAKLLHIVAWVLVEAYSKATQEEGAYFKRKAAKLMTRLAELNDEESLALARCYPSKSAPDLDTVLKCLKEKKRGVPFSQVLQKALNRPFSSPRSDHGTLAITREEDFRRMLADTRLSNGADKRPLSVDEIAAVTSAMLHLKSLENGLVISASLKKPVADLSRQELIDSFKELSLIDSLGRADSSAKVTLWALLFEALGRTTGKYPHLAQQFSLLVNDLCTGDVSSRVLQLATGEGKSHFVALRAARLAALGFCIDVCTAKRSLAERDLKDYQDFFSYLGLTASLIYPHSPLADYTAYNIHYMTLADFSLFVDGITIKGESLNLDKDSRIGLVDEFDFIRYEEGTKTQYNYAALGAKLPKAMQWFYEITNQFYELHKDSLSTLGHFTKAHLIGFRECLASAAGDDEEKRRIVKSLVSNPIQLVQWLQAAHQADSLKRDVDYCIVEKEVEIEGESHHLCEIIPLSSDAQRMEGSTFSDGVHQLLAMRLNAVARVSGKPENFHVHPESSIISSQIASVCMQRFWGRWEGFTGTVSLLQAVMLDKENETVVLHVPTNQRDLRIWHKPSFHSDEIHRFQALSLQLRSCLAEKRSVLLSCKNDKEVHAVMRHFTDMHAAGHLTDEEFAALLPYTNESFLSPLDILNKKRTLEEWTAGGKTQGICLVAACFGRGDNVGVEAVFLVSVGDANDLLQKGGRTARNGAPGDVYQFYLESAVREEESSIIATLRAHHIDVAALYKENFGIDLVPGITEITDDFLDNCHQRLLRLREYMHWYTDQANQGYRYVRARFTAWGMQFLASLATVEPAKRAKILASYKELVQQLEEAWTEIAAKSMPVKAKIVEFEALIIIRAEELVREYRESTSLELLAYTADPYPEAKLIFPKSIVRAADPRAIQVIELCGRLMTLAGRPSAELAHHVMHYLKMMSRDSVQLSQLMHDWKFIYSWPALEASLLVTEAVDLERIDEEEIFERVFASLGSPSIIVPHSTSLKLFYSRFILPITDTNEQRIDGLLHLLQAMMQNPTERLRLLTIFELWTFAEPRETKLAFLTAFLRVMTASVSKEQWVVFNRLVSLTHAWWDKDGVMTSVMPYKSRLRLMWQHIAESPSDPLIVWSLSNPGKAWFEVLNILLLLNPSLRFSYSKELASLWGSIIEHSAREKKSKHLAYLAEAVEVINELSLLGYSLNKSEVANWRLLQGFATLLAAFKPIEDGTKRLSLLTGLTLFSKQIAFTSVNKRQIDLFITELVKTLPAEFPLFMLRAKKFILLFDRLSHDEFSQLLISDYWDSAKAIIFKADTDENHMEIFITEVRVHLDRARASIQARQMATISFWGGSGGVARLAPAAPAAPSVIIGTAVLPAPNLATLMSAWGGR